MSSSLVVPKRIESNFSSFVTCKMVEFTLFAKIKEQVSVRPQSGVALYGYKETRA